MSTIHFHITPPFLDVRIRTAVNELLPANYTRLLVDQIRQRVNYVVRQALIEREILPNPFVAVETVSIDQMIWITVAGETVPGPLTSKIQSIMNQTTAVNTQTNALKQTLVSVPEELLSRTDFDISAIINAQHIGPAQSLDTGIYVRQPDIEALGEGHPAPEVQAFVSAVQQLEGDLFLFVREDNFDDLCTEMDGPC